MTKRKTKVQRMQEEDHDHLLMMEVISYQCLRNPQPQNLVGQFILTYQLFPTNQMGCPVMADKINEVFSKFSEKYGYAEYDRRKVFAAFKDWGIKSERVKDGDIDTKFYMVNPLHKLGDE